MENINPSVILNKAKRFYSDISFTYNYNQLVNFFCGGVMETQYFKTLLAVVKTASFSKAASELCITQSAVSQRIKSMEERYGHQLLDRSGVLLVATEAGRIVLEKAERILLGEREMTKELAKLSGNRRLSLCCTPTFGIVYLPQVLSSFLLDNSDTVDLKLIFSTPDQAIRGLVDNEYDLAVIEHCDEIRCSEFIAFALPKDELVFITARKSTSNVKALQLNELLSLRLITRNEGCSARRRLELNLQKAGISLHDFKSVVVLDDLRLTIETVITGDSVAFVSRSLVEAQIAAGVLCAHTIDACCHLRYRTLLVNRNRGVPELIESFMESLNRVFDKKLTAGLFCNETGNILNSVE
jgi:DNA-binding transcriptional LysR family regulator